MSSGPCITLASYNMHKAVGLDGRRDPHRVLRVLQEIDADIVALQEADRRIGGRGSTVPHELIDSHGEDHAKTFDVSCEIAEPAPIRAEGRGSSRRAAEQDAAETVLRRLQELQQG